MINIDIIENMKITKPTHIQAAAIAQLMEKHDA